MISMLDFDQSHLALAGLPWIGTVRNCRLQRPIWGLAAWGRN